MRVFKGYGNIIKRNIGVMVMYVCIFIGISVAIQKSLGDTGVTGNFAAVKLAVAVIDREGGALGDTLKSYLQREQKLVEIADDEQTIQEELFYRNISYVLIVPQGTQAAFENGEAAVQTIKVPGSSAGFYLDAKINSLLNQIRVYQTGGFSFEESCEKALALSERKGQVTLLDINGNGGQRADYNYYFAYLPYAMLTGIIMCLSSVVMTFKKKEIRRRMTCSSVSLLRQNMAATASFLLVGLAVWGVCVVVQAALYRGGAFTSPNCLWYMLNSFACMVVAMTLAYLCGTVVNSVNALNGINNVVSLGLCFIGGIFVPIEMLGSGVKKAAGFTPTYWYSQINSILGDYEHLSTEMRQNILQGLAIQLLFTAACFCVTLAISKARQRE